MTIYEAKGFQSNLVYPALDTIIETQKAILQGVASGQITFVNKSKGEEGLDESIRE
ncbi:Uncharacterised protein [Streptococcus pneumoniae]|nr:Uncharacterised protein [Streptococcus pneumoniae]